MMTPRTPCRRSSHEQHWTAKAGAKKNVFVFMGHDVTVCPLLVALGVWDKTWPDYAATVAIELYAPGQSASTGAPCPSHAVSVLYNGEPMRVPGSFEGNGRWLLPLEIFFDRVATINAGSELNDGQSAR